MDRLIWTAVTGMNASMDRQRMIASNMANAQTTGFRAEVMAQRPMTLLGPTLFFAAFKYAEAHREWAAAFATAQLDRPRA